jgi:IclR family transcriptional regulator, pca regulon regulatory protein
MDERSEATGVIGEEDPSFVAALARGLAVIRAFDAAREAQTLADLAKATKLPRATVRRSLLTLQALGYVRCDGKHFKLTPRILSLGYAYLASTPLTRVLQPALERVSEATHESCSACTLDGPEIVYVGRAATKRIMSVGLSVGSRLPAYCTSMGRVLLAAEPEARARAILARSDLRRLTPRTICDMDGVLRVLAQVREQGWCLVDEELEIGLRSLAVPIRSAGGQVLAAMNVSAQAGRISADDLVRVALPELLAAAASIRPSLVG